MRHYRPASSSERDARVERLRAGGLLDGAPFVGPLDNRQPFDWSFACGGVTWSLHFEPNPRDVRQWRVFRDGELWMCAGFRARVAGHAAGDGACTGTAPLALTASPQAAFRERPLLADSGT